MAWQVILNVHVELKHLSQPVPMFKTTNRVSRGCSMEWEEKNITQY